MFPHFPYTNFHALNLDWVIKKIQSAVMAINGHSPDENGNVTITPTDVDAVATVNGITPDAAGNVNVGTVKSVNNLLPNTSGNVNVGTVKSVNNTLPDSAGNVNLTTIAGVTSVGGVGPDGNGNVPISVNHRIPNATGNITLRPSNIDPQNVKYYGAVGDGVADDTTAFRNALQQIKDVIVPPGTYNITDLEMPSDSCLRGTGINSIINLSGTIYINGTGDTIELHDLVINLNKDANAQSFAMNLLGVNNGIIENVKIEGHGRGVAIGGNNNIIKDCYFKIDEYALLVVENSNTIKISNSEILRYTDTANNSLGVYVRYNSKNVFLNECAIDGFGISCRIEHDCDNIEFQACEFFDTHVNNNIEILGTCTNIVIEGTYLSANSNIITTDSSCDGLIISNSLLKSATAGTNAIYSSNGGNVNNVLITNSAILTSNGFRNVDNTSIDNWIISHCLFGKYGNEPTITTGYVFSDGDSLCSNYLVIGCSFIGRTQIATGSQVNKTFVNNLGYTP